MDFCYIITLNCEIFLLLNNLPTIISHIFIEASFNALYIFLRIYNFYAL